MEPCLCHVLLLIIVYIYIIFIVSEYPNVWCLISDISHSHCRPFSRTVALSHCRSLASLNRLVALSLSSLSKPFSRTVAL